MNKKIVGIFIMTLLIFSTTFSVKSDSGLSAKQEEYKLVYPQDFEFLGVSGGFPPVTALFKLHINSNGEAVYSILYPGDRDSGLFTLIATFSFTESEMNEIWEIITSNDFFNLDGLYQYEAFDGTYAEMTISGEGNTKTVRTENIIVPSFDNIVKKINSLTPGNNDLYYNAIFNYQPWQPSKPSGETNGKPLKKYTYKTISIDDNEDQLFYFFDWGDGRDSGWIGPFNSGETASADHIWTSKGSYNIRVKAKDDPDGDGDLSDGKESRWSDPLSVSMPKNTNKLNLYLFEVLMKLRNNHHLFDVLYEILYNKESVVYSETDLSSGNTDIIGNMNFCDIDDCGTRVKIKDCDITVNLYIQIWGDAANAAAAKAIEDDIEGVWNKNPAWRVKCKEGCDPRDPGCSVTFDAHVEVRGYNESPKEGYHQIQMKHDDSTGDPWKPPGSYIDDGDRGDPNDRVLDHPRPNDDSHPTSTGVMDDHEPDHTPAHEAGHLMGLDDTYPPHKVGFGDHIMNHNGAVRQEDIDLIIGMSGVECPCECCPKKKHNISYNDGYTENSYRWTDDSPWIAAIELSDPELIGYRDYQLTNVHFCTGCDALDYYSVPYNIYFATGELPDRYQLGTSDAPLIASGVSSGTGWDTTEVSPQDISDSGSAFIIVEWYDYYYSYPAGIDENNSDPRGAYLLEKETENNWVTIAEYTGYPAVWGIDATLTIP